MKEYKKRELKFKWEGDVHSVSFPTNRMLQEHLKKSSDEKEDSLPLVIGFLEELGLKEGIGWDMEPYMLEDIMSEFSQKKR